MSLTRCIYDISSHKRLVPHMLSSMTDILVTVQCTNVPVHFEAFSASTRPVSLLVLNSKASVCSCVPVVPHETLIILHLSYFWLHLW